MKIPRPLPLELTVMPVGRPPPPGLNYLVIVEASYTFVLISLPVSSILVPILLLIFFQSTSTARRTLVFNLNILIVLLGIIEAILSTLIQSITILRPQRVVSDHLFLAYIALAFCTPILVDCVLILRLNAVYPANITRRATRLAILAVPLFCTAVRFGCVSSLFRRWALHRTQSSAFQAGDVVWRRNPMIITDWSIQLFENIYCSSLFLFRLRDHKAFSSRMYHNQSIAMRIRALFYIAVSNFVFPSILSIVQIIYIVHDPSIIHGAIVLMANNYVSIIGVVFSTIWCSSDVWERSHNDSLPRVHDPGIAFPQSMITLSGIAPNLVSGLHPNAPRHTTIQLYKGSESAADLSQERVIHPPMPGGMQDADTDSAAETLSRSPITPPRVDGEGGCT